MIPTLHWHSGILEANGQCPIRLGWKKRQLLVALARGAGRDHAYGRLIQILWPDPEGEPGNPPNLIHVHIMQMKDKLLPFGLRIRTDAGWGKQLDGDFHIDWRRSETWGYRFPNRPYEGLRA